jgi:PadR family transcriptional regulator, regulatory protein AphA
VSYVVLGLVAQGATTSYDMKQKASRSVGYFWNFPHSQLYAEPARLVELGLLHEEREAEGRRRRVYSLTPAGHKALDDWLREPTSEQPQIRDTGLLKLFFGDGMSADEIAALARAQEEAHRERLAVYETIGDTATNANHAAVVHAGLLHERTFADFWRELGATPPSPSSPGSAAGRR